jgi:hypothetical protein
MSDVSQDPYESPTSESVIVGRKSAFNSTRAALLAMVVVVVRVIGFRLHWMYERYDCLYSIGRIGCGPVAAHSGDAPWSIRMLGASGYSSIGVSKNSPEPWTGVD